MYHKSESSEQTDTDLFQSAPKKSYILLSIIVGILLLVTLGAVWYLTNSGTGPDRVGLDTKDETIVEDEQHLFSGNLYYSAMEDLDRNPAAWPQVLRYDFSSDQVSVWDTGPTISYTFGQEVDMAISYYENTNDPDGYQPSLVFKDGSTPAFASGQQAYFENDITISADDEFYAFSFRFADALDDVDFPNPELWGVAVHRVDDGSAKAVINGAFSPQWLSGNTDFIYLREDGIYIFNLDTEVEQNIFPQFTGLNSYDDLYFSEQHSLGIISLGAEGNVLLFDFEIDNDREEIIITPHDIFQIEERVIRYPVIDPTGSYYAVYSAPLAFTENAQSHQIEIRAIETHELVHVVDVSSYERDSISLEAWLSN